MHIVDSVSETTSLHGFVLRRGFLRKPGTQESGTESVRAAADRIESSAKSFGTAHSSDDVHFRAGVVVDRHLDVDFWLKVFCHNQRENRPDVRRLVDRK
jgi:hypothetical protein